jgi:hypothetical protein
MPYQLLLRQRYYHCSVSYTVGSTGTLTVADRAIHLFATMDQGDWPGHAAAAVFISGGRGCGKSRVLQYLPTLLQQRAATDAAALPQHKAHREQLQRMFSAENHIQLSTSFTNEAPLQEHERRVFGHCAISIRALYSAFGDGVSFEEFIDTVSNECNAFRLTMYDIVRALAVRRHVPALGKAQRPMFITYTIDDAHCITPTSSEFAPPPGIEYGTIMACIVHTTFIYIYICLCTSESRSTMSSGYSSWVLFSKPHTLQYCIYRYSQTLQVMIISTDFLPTSRTWHNWHTRARMWAV